MSDASLEHLEAPSVMLAFFVGGGWKNPALVLLLLK